MPLSVHSSIPANAFFIVFCYEARLFSALAIISNVRPFLSVYVPSMAAFKVLLSNTWSLGMPSNFLRFWARGVRSGPEIISLYGLMFSSNSFIYSRVSLIEPDLTLYRSYCMEPRRSVSLPDLLNL